MWTKMNCGVNSGNTAAKNKDCLVPEEAAEQLSWQLFHYSVKTVGQ